MTIKINGDVYLSRKEAATYIGKARGTLEVWASKKTKVIRHVMIGGRAYYSIKLLDIYLEQSLVK